MSEVTNEISSEIDQIELEPRRLVGQRISQLFEYDGEEMWWDGTIIEQIVFLTNVCY